ncbi:MAG TPA: hypothetical protein VJZ00_07920, partial [Thermoanaerobaculia bacterium]|nr:hypothetical protein [Thermoanaerobaculia bacterium]
ARELARVGKYDEAIAAYDALIARYPHSVAAAEERSDVQELLAAANEPKTEVTKTARKSQREKVPEAAPEAKKQPSRWERVKRWFRGT